MIQALKEIGHDFANSFWRHYIIWAFVLTAAVIGLNMELFWLYRHDFFYTDTDCWMRAMRITDWLQNFQWSETIFPWTNPPHGFVLHWTRACDVIWALLCLPFLPFLLVMLGEVAFFCILGLMFCAFMSNFTARYALTEEGSLTNLFLSTYAWKHLRCEIYPSFCNPVPPTGIRVRSGMPC